MVEKLSLYSPQFLNMTSLLKSAMIVQSTLYMKLVDLVQIVREVE